MRHLRTGLIAATFLTGCLISMLSSAETTPVFKQLDSRFASGEYSRDWLEDHTDASKTQIWYRVETDSKLKGWIAEDHLLTVLKFVEEARLKESMPLRSSASLDALMPGPPLEKNSSVLILEVQGSWARVRGLSMNDNKDSWLPSDSLIPETNRITRVFIHTGSPLHVLPGLHARTMGAVKEQSFAQVISVKKDWIEIHAPSGTGFIERRNAWTVNDVANRELRPALLQTPLRSGPSPAAALIENLGIGTKLKFIEAQTIKWGQVKISGLGPMWWPIDSDSGPESLAPEKPASTLHKMVRSEDLFTRKIFDMAASKAMPSLKFLSANGIYRTLDNENWEKILLFKNDNQPIAIAKAGTVFIGPYRSNDHGETFQQWIRWEKLVSAIAVHGTASPKNLRIAEIRPDNDDGNAVTLRLTTNTDTSIRLKTQDGGLTWLRY